MKKILALGVGCALVFGAIAAQAQGTRAQVVSAQSLTISAEVVALDATTRKVTLKGPFGGLIAGTVSDEVKDLSRIKVGDLVSASYYEAVAASVHRKGDEKPLFSATDIAAKAEPGTKTAAAAVTAKSVTVFSVDAVANTLVLQGADRTLYPINVERREFQAKLKDLKVGDQIDIAYSEALVTGLTPLAAGEEAKVTMKVGTIVIDKGEVVRRIQNTLIIRNENGRMLKVTVPGDFKFQLDGKEATVFDVRDGTRLERTALRVSEASYSN